MPKVTVVFGVLLIILGLVGYLGTGSESPTALIPAAFGVLLALCGVLAFNEARLKHAMHGAAVLALLGLLGTARGIPGALTLLGGGTVERSSAVIAQAIMAVLMLIFLVLCIRSFIEARKAREAGA